MPLDYAAGLPLSDAYTACLTALQQLQRLGQSALAEPLLDEAADDVAAVTGPIQLDSTRSESYKSQTLARLYISVLNSLSRKLTAAATSAGSQDSTDAANVFGVSGLAGDVASLAISRRDAGDRVADIVDPMQRQRLLEQAARTGDDCLSRAIVQSAMDANDVDTVNAFITAYPALADAVQRLWDAAHRKTDAVDMVMQWRLAALKPGPITALQNYEIAALADGNTDAGQWNA